MRVLGIDPGLTRCGLALIETAPGRAVTALDVDVLRTTSDEPLERRLRAVHSVADEWMEIHRPDVVAIERVFAQNNAPTVVGTAQATAMIFLVFLYWLAAMFLFGGEINGTVIAARRQRLQARSGVWDGRFLHRESSVG